MMGCIVMSKKIFQTTNLRPDFIIDLLSENDAAKSPEMTGSHFQVHGVEIMKLSTCKVSNISFCCRKNIQRAQNTKSISNWANNWLYSR